MFQHGIGNCVLNGAAHELHSDHGGQVVPPPLASAFIGAEDEAEMPFLTQMAALASRIYKPQDTTSDDWKLAKVWNLADSREGGNATNEESNVGIFTSEKEKTCVLAFAGTNNATDVEKDLATRSKLFCGNISGSADKGWQVHEGFLDRTNEFWKGKRFEEFKNFLSDRHTCGKVIVTGHSLGGSIANMVAACANKTHASHIDRSFKTDYLFTFAAPGVSKDQQLENVETANGCFPGARVYNLEDPVPALTNPLQFYHPKVMEVRLDGHGAGEARTWNCDDTSRKDMPEVRLEDDAETHPIAVHIQRMKKLQDSGSEIFKWGMEKFDGASAKEPESNQDLHETEQRMPGVAVLDRGPALEDDISKGSYAEHRPAQHEESLGEVESPPLLAKPTLASKEIANASPQHEGLGKAGEPVPANGASAQQTDVNLSSKTHESSGGVLRNDTPSEKTRTESAHDVEKAIAIDRRKEDAGKTPSANGRDFADESVIQQRSSSADFNSNGKATAISKEKEGTGATLRNMGNPDKKEFAGGATPPTVSASDPNIHEEATAISKAKQSTGPIPKNAENSDEKAFTGKSTPPTVSASEPNIQDQAPSQRESTSNMKANENSGVADVLLATSLGTSRGAGVPLKQGAGAQ